MFIVLFHSIFNSHLKTVAAFSHKVNYGDVLNRYKILDVEEFSIKILSKLILMPLKYFESFLTFLKYYSKLGKENSRFPGFESHYVQFFIRFLNMYFDSYNVFLV